LDYSRLSLPYTIEIHPMAIAQKFDSFGTYLETLNTLERERQAATESGWSVLDKAKRAIIITLTAGPSDREELADQAHLAGDVARDSLAALVQDGLVEEVAGDKLDLTAAGLRLSRLLR
jgi:hypothetical protein